MPDTTLIEELKNIMKKCDICEGIMTNYGHNAAPITNGKCCDRCNIDTVIPARLESVVKIVPDISEEQKKIELEKEKKRVYMREYMRKYHAKNKNNDENYTEKVRANQRKANAKRRQRDDVKEAEKVYHKKWSAERTRKIQLLKQLEAKILDIKN